MNCYLSPALTKGCRVRLRAFANTGALLIPMILLFANIATATQITFAGTAGNSAGPYYVAPYFVQVDTSNTVLPVTCLDAAREVANGYRWDVDVNTITDADLDFAPDYQNYKVAAVLWTWLQDGQVTPGAGQYAIWNLFRPAFSMAPGGPGAATAQAMAMDYVAKNPGLNYSNITIFTPLNHGPRDDQYQEFMTGRIGVPGPLVSSAAETPEPETYGLMVSGLLMIWLGFRAQRWIRRTHSLPIKFDSENPPAC